MTLRVMSSRPISTVAHRGAKKEANASSLFQTAVELRLNFPSMEAPAFSRSIFSFSMRSRSAFVIRGFRGAPVPRPLPRPLPDVGAAAGSVAFAARVACVTPAAAEALPRPRPRPLVDLVALALYECQYSA